MKRRIWQITMAFLLGQILLQSVPQTSFALIDCTDRKKDCDTTERCEYLAQIQMKEQIQELFNNKKLKAEAIAQAKEEKPGANPKDISHHAAGIMYTLVMDKAKDGKTIVLPTCNSSLEAPPGWETDTKCRFYPLRKNGGELLIGDVESKNTCREFVDASIEHEKYHAACCEAAKANPKIDRKDITVYINEEVKAYQIEIDYLNKMKFWKKSICTPKETTVQNAAVKAANGAKALKKKGGK